MAGALPRRLLVLGLGYAAGHVVDLLRPRGVQCGGTSRNTHLAANGVIHHRWQGGDPEPALREAIAGADALLCSIPPDADGDPGFRVLGDAIAGSDALRWIGYFSSTAVYAGRDGATVDANAIADGRDAAALARLRAESQWLALATGKDIAAAVFRLPGLYGIGRNALRQLANGSARHLVKPGHVFSRIHVEDVAQAVAASMQRTRGRQIYLLADDEPAPPQDVLAYAAQLAGLPLPPARIYDEATASPSLRRFYGNGKRIDSRHARTALAWQPRYRDYRQGLLAAWQAGDGRGAG